MKHYFVLKNIFIQILY